MPEVVKDKKIDNGGQMQFLCALTPKLVSEYDQEIPQSQTADKPRGGFTQQSRDTRKTNYAKQPALSLPHQDNY